MAYRDFDAAMARGMWSPPNGAAPQILPDQWKDNPGDELRYDLPDKTDDELVALGWLKIDMPSYATNGAAFFINNYEWNSSTRSFDATEIDEIEKGLRVDYDLFWTGLLNLDVYSTLKTAASTELAANVMLTEFIALLDDAKRGLPDVASLQASISGILSGITMSSTERTELEALFESTGMTALYTFS